MRFLVTILFCLFPMLASAQSYQFEPTPTPVPIQLAWNVVVAGGNAGAAATPTATPTATPVPPTVLCRMDFDGTGCVDTVSAHTCTAGVNYDADCTTGDCPIGTTKSGWTTAIGGSINTFGDGANCADVDTTDVTMDFLFRIPDAQSGTQSVDEIVGIAETGLSYLAGMTYRGLTNEVTLRCGQDTSSSGGCNISDDVTYNIRINYNGDSVQGWLYVDTGSEWGRGNVDSGACAVTCDSADAADNAATWKHQDRADDVSSIIDDVAICDATGGFLAQDVQCD